MAPNADRTRRALTKAERATGAAEAAIFLGHAARWLRLAVLDNELSAAEADELRLEIDMAEVTN
jgi:hypothetical protein